MVSGDAFCSQLVTVSLDTADPRVAELVMTTGPDPITMPCPEPAEPGTRFCMWHTPTDPLDAARQALGG